MEKPALASAELGELVEEIGRLYALGAARRWSDLGGSGTTNLRIDLAEQSLVARVHRRDTAPERLAAIQAARHAVARAGVPTVTPIPLPDGAGYTTLASGQLVELEPMLCWDTRMNTDTLVEQGFGTLATVHDALRAADLPPAAGTTTYANYVDPGQAVAASRRGVRRVHGWSNPALSEFADAALDHVARVARLEERLDAQHVRQVVHGDFWDNNVLFRGDRLVAVIDFDFMARRPRVEDLALTAYFLFLQPGRGLPTRTDAALLRRFADAYDGNTTLPLNAGERAALPLAIARQPAWSLGRWIALLPEDGARQHATEVLEELPVAQAIFADLDYWQRTLLA